MKLRKKTTMWIILPLIIIFTAIYSFMNNPSFGRLPRGERLEKIKNSPNYRDGEFRNQNPTIQLTTDKSKLRTMAGFLFRKKDNLRPQSEIPHIKTNFHGLDPTEDIMVWLGHGSYYLRIDGKKYLVDPVFYSAAPVSFFNRPFKGTDIFKSEDIPDIDYLILTHDHWDHLDYRTVKELKHRTGKVICPLGVGEHLEYWGYGKDMLIEMDWYEDASLDNRTAVHCLPARHFSGRGLKSNQTLWASFMIATPDKTIFISGDGGYDSHFAEIAERFPSIDLAVLENGQYDENWKYIHLLPADLIKVINDLSPEKVITVHNSKYALANHPWDEPLRKISETAENDRFTLLTPMIGEPVYLNDSTQAFTRWWNGII